MGCKGIHVSVGQVVMGKKKLRRRQVPTHSTLFFWMLGIRSKFPPGEMHTHSHALVCLGMAVHTHTHTHAHIYHYGYCLREDKVQLFHRASYFPVCSWKTSQGSLRLSVLSADGSLKGRMDVSSRQGHQTHNERWEWWWQGKKRDREKIAGVTASTCSPQLNDQQVPQREREREGEREG